MNFTMVGWISRVWQLTFLFNAFHINSDIEPTSKIDLRQLLINHTNPTKLWNQKYTKQEYPRAETPYMDRWRGGERTQLCQKSMHSKSLAFWESGEEGSRISFNDIKKNDSLGYWIIYWTVFY